jgi:ABC-type uncharacterized transport system auxiliary subunit
MKVLLSLLFAALLSACSSIPESPAQKVFAATSAYNAALSAAVAYKKLPACGQTASPTLCSDKGVVATVQKADNVAFEALKSAQTVVRQTGQTETSLQTAVRWATEAIAAFSRVVETLGVK